MTRLEYNRCLICEIRGICCYFSSPIEGRNVILLNHPCVFLNTETGLCVEYKNRNEVFERCLSIDKAKLIGALPEGCLYLKKDEKLPFPPKIKPNLDTCSERFKIRYEYLNNLPHNTYQKEKTEA